MLNNLLLNILLICTLTLLSCGKKSGGSNSVVNTPAQTEENPETIIFDNELTENEKTELRDDIEIISTLVIDGSQIRNFNQIFSGSNSASVLTYLTDRLNYILGANTDLAQRVTVSEIALNAETIATNQGTALWFQSKIEEPSIIQISINDQSIPINSSRVGIIQLGYLFVRLSNIFQAATLVHEARHSDCSGGILATDIERLKNNKLPLNSKCGHLHAVCPPGHELEGEYACDAHPWGAYGVEAIYAAAIARTCESCRPPQITVAEVITLDSISRLLYDFSSLMNGTLGPPDMTSSNQVR